MSCQQPLFELFHEKKTGSSIVHQTPRRQAVIPEFLKTNPRLALYAFFAVAASGFGQTFFVSVMGGAFREAFELSHTAYGSLYSGGTLLSALLLLRFGSLADAWSLPKVTALALGILAAGCLLISSAPSFLFLGLGFVLIRFGGQGLMAHLGITTAARYFSRHRGKAVALAGFGFPLAEACLPPGAVFMMERMDWRWAWLAGSAVLLLLIFPLLAFLSRKTPAPRHDVRITDSDSVNDRTRSQVLRDPGFYLILPATLVTPFVVTALFFHQVAIAQALGWSLKILAGAFTGYAAGHLLALLLAGPVVDRLGAGRTLPLTLLPMFLSLVLLAVARGSWVALLYMVLLGVTQGFAATAGGAVWAELYGLVHLGSIRSLTQAIMVVATAIAPVLMGFLLDLGLPVSSLSLIMAAGLLAASCLAWITLHNSRRRV